MKPIKNAFVLLLTLSFFISCSKDDAPSNDAPSNEEIAPQLTVQDLLSTSKTNYENAVNGTWVQVTEDEYNLLATQLHHINRSGISESNYQLTPDTNTNSFNWTISHVVNTPETIPANSYFFAVKYEAGWGKSVGV